MKYTASLVVCGNDEVLADRLGAGSDPSGNGWSDESDMAVQAATSILQRAGYDYRLETNFRAYNGGPRKGLIEVVRWEAENEEGECESVEASEVPAAEVAAVEEVIDRAASAMQKEMNAQVEAEEARRAAADAEEAK